MRNKQTIRLILLLVLAAAFVFVSIKMRQADASAASPVSAAETTSALTLLTDAPDDPGVPADPDDPWLRPAWQTTGTRETRWLLGLAGAKHSASRRPEAPWERDERWVEFAVPAAADAPTNGSKLVRYSETESNWFFPLWDSETTRGAAFDPATGERVASGEEEDFSLLWFLYDYKRESAPADGHEYVRRRVLWRLYHDETLDGDRSIDVFPGIGIDRKKDGYRKVSFLWRLFRYVDEPGKGTSLDILFLPILRP